MNDYLNAVANRYTKNSLIYVPDECLYNYSGSTTSGLPSIDTIRQNTFAHCIKCKHPVYRDNEGYRHYTCNCKVGIMYE